MQQHRDAVYGRVIGDLLVVGVYVRNSPNILCVEPHPLDLHFHSVSHMIACTHTQAHTPELVQFSWNDSSWNFVQSKSGLVCYPDGRGERADPRHRRCPPNTRHGRPRRTGPPASTGEWWLGLASWPTPGIAWRLQNGIYDALGMHKTVNNLHVVKWTAVTYPVEQDVFVMRIQVGAASQNLAGCEPHRCVYNCKL